MIPLNPGYSSLSRQLTLLLLERRPVGRAEIARAVPKTADENTLRARAERELLRKLKALSRQPGVRNGA